VMRRVFIFVLAVLMLAACSKQAPEITAQEQVPADQRTEAAPADGEGGDGEGEGGGGDATFVAIDIAYESAPETLPAGENEITIVNNGQAVHDVTFEDLGDVTVVSANGGQTASGNVTLEAGEHYYYCSVPGHREAGMEGTLTAE
jgi:plastocyanin